MEEEIQKAFTKRNLPREIKISIKAGQEKKGEEIVVMDLRNNSSFTDIFLIMHGNSGRQNIAIFSQKARQYYSLEKLWGDSPRIEY